MIEDVKKGAVVIDKSSIAPLVSRKIAASLHEKGRFITPDKIVRIFVEKSRLI